MFERLGNKSELAPVKVVLPSSNITVRKLGDGFTTAREETDLAIASHVKHMNSKPVKVLSKKAFKKSRQGQEPTLTDRMPRLPHVTGHNKIPANLLAVFSQLRMDGPGFLVRKHAGRVAAARLSQWLTQERLHGRGITQAWEDGDMVFWVGPDF